MRGKQQARAKGRRADGRGAVSFKLSPATIEAWRQYAGKRGMRLSQLVQAAMAETLGGGSRLLLEECLAVLERGQAGGRDQLAVDLVVGRLRKALGREPKEGR